MSSSGGGGFVRSHHVRPIRVPLLGGRSHLAGAERHQGDQPGGCRGRAGSPQALPVPPVLSHNPPAAEQHHGHRPHGNRCRSLTVGLCIRWYISVKIKVPLRSCPHSELPAAAEGRVLHQRLVPAHIRPPSGRAAAQEPQSESGHRCRSDRAAAGRQQRRRSRQTRRLPPQQVLQTPVLHTGQHSFRDVTVRKQVNVADVLCVSPQ